MSERYAVYYSPEESTPLADFGQRVLGRTAGGCTVAASEDDYPDRQLAASLSATPAHYGFHATLKAPFHLRKGQSEDLLLSAVEALAQQQTPITMHTLEPRKLSGFAALVFAVQPTKVHQLANQCVEQLEAFRAPLTPEDIQRRKPDTLSETQQYYLKEYGYPFVLSEFRFHMTLTGSLHSAEHAHYFAWLDALYRQCVPSPPVLDRLMVFWQQNRTKPFKRLQEFSFG